MHSKLLCASVLLAITVSLGVGPGLAEKGGHAGKAPDKVEGKAEVRMDAGKEHSKAGAGGKAAFEKKVQTPSGVKVNLDKAAGSHAEVRVHHKDTPSRKQGNHGASASAPGQIRKEESGEIRNDRHEAKSEAGNHGREIFRRSMAEDHRDKMKDRGERVGFRNRVNRDEDDQLGEEFKERVVLVQGVPADDPHVVLVDVTPENEDFIVHLIRAHQQDESWIDRFASSLPFGIRQNFEVGHTVPPGLFKKVSLLPADVNAQLGLPDDDAYRVGVLGNKLVLFDVERRLVLDVLEYDQDQLQLADIRLPSEKLYAYRIDDRDVDEVVAYLQAHPEVLYRDESFGDRFRRVVLTPIGLAEALAIGDPLPGDIEVSLLPVSLNAQLDLSDTDLRLGLYGDDLVLIDPRTAVVIDVADNII